MGQFAAPQQETREVMEQRKTWLEKQLAAISQQIQGLDKK
jgi:predicted metal-dependent hydrolase